MIGLCNFIKPVVFYEAVMDEFVNAPLKGKYITGVFLPLNHIIYQSKWFSIVFIDIGEAKPVENGDAFPGEEINQSAVILEHIQHAIVEQAAGGGVFFNM